jgi:hypothetical protein
LLGRVLVRGDFLLADVVDEGLSSFHVYHLDLLVSLRRCWISGHGRRLRDGWRVKLVDEDSRWYLCASRAKIRQDVRCDVVVADDVMELETIEFVPKLANFQSVGVHVLLVTIPRLVDLVDDHCGVAID